MPGSHGAAQGRVPSQAARCSSAPAYCGGFEAARPVPGGSGVVLSSKRSLHVDGRCASIRGAAVIAGERSLMGEPRWARGR